MKLLTKVSFIVIGGTTIAILVAGFLVFTFSRSELEQSISASQSELAIQTIDKIDRFLFERYLNIQSIAGEDMIEGFILKRAEHHDPSLIQDRIKNLTFLTGPWDALFVTNKEGIILASTDEEKIGRLQKEEPLNFEAFQSVLSSPNEVYYSDVVISDDTGKPTIIFASPIRDKHSIGQPVIGAIIGNFSWQVITEILQNIEIVSHLELFTRNGELIAKNQASKATLFVKNEEALPLIERALKQKSVITLVESEPEEEELTSLISIAPSSGYLGYRGNSWTLFVETPIAIAFAPAQKHAIQTALFLVPIFLAAFGLILLFLWRLVVVPITSLSQLTKTIAGGDLSKRAVVHSRDEIGQLAESFNKMTSELGTLYAGLEDKIRERTREIQDEKNKLEVTLESIGDGAFSTDALGRIVFFNKVAEEISGYKADEVIGKPYRSVLRFVLEKDDSENYKFIEDVFTKGVISRISNHTILITKDGRRVPVEDSAAPLKDDHGKVVGAVVIFRDVTKARELEKTKINFISIASHQLRTPLSALRWIAEMFLGGDLGKLTENQNRFLSDMYKSTRRLLDLVNILLVSSRVEEGRVDIKPVPTDIVALTRDVIAGLEPLIKAKNLNLVMVDKLLPKISLEPEMLRQVVLNLISNAVNYTPSGGRIAVQFELGQDFITYSVEDTGIGIPQKDQYRIFEKFFRAENAIAEAADGTGLGLNLAKSIVLTWDGDMRFESEEGKGTTFYFTIPLVGMKPRSGEIKINA